MVGGGPRELLFGGVAGRSRDWPEAIEAEFPLHTARYGLRRDSGSAGCFRGGLGCAREYDVLSGPIAFTRRGEHHHCPGRGFTSSLDGARAVTCICAGGTIADNSSENRHPLRNRRPGNIETAGGGWGPPSEPDPSLLAADIRNGKASAAAGARDWGLAEPLDESACPSVAGEVG